MKIKVRLKRFLFGSMSAAMIAAGLAHANPVAPTVLSMQYVQGMNIHLAGNEGAINRHDKMDIRVELLPEQKVRAVDSGERSEHNLFSNFSTRDETRWKNSWRGTWAMVGETLRLHLTLADRTCEKSKTQSGRPPEKKTCGALSQQLRFECRSEQLAITEWSGPPDNPKHEIKKHAVWRCGAADSFEFADTPSRWLFGKSICIKVIGGRPGESYEKCSAN
jgi:hypothetical protein